MRHCCIHRLLSGCVDARFFRRWVSQCASVWEVHPVLKCNLISIETRVSSCREKEYTQEPTIRGHSWWSQSERELSNGVSEDYTLSRLSLSSKTDSFSTRFVCDQLSRFLLWLMSISRNVILYPSPYFDCSYFSAESRTEWTIPTQGIKRRGTEQNINYLYLSSEPWDYYSTTDFCVVFLMDWSGILSRRSSIPTAERLGYKIRTYLVLL